MSRSNLFWALSLVICTFLAPIVIWLSRIGQYEYYIGDAEFLSLRFNVLKQVKLHGYINLLSFAKIYIVDSGCEILKCIQLLICMYYQCNTCTVQYNSTRGIPRIIFLHIYIRLLVTAHRSDL
jgi:hypothetical protein